MSGARVPAAALALALVVPVAGPATAPPGGDAFGLVGAREGRLVEDGREFRFLSLNVPNLHYVEDDMRLGQPTPFRWPDEYEIADALESIRQLGGRVVRTYALAVRKRGDPEGTPRHVLGPGRFDEEGFRALDVVLDVAREKRVRVIVPLVDNWSWWGGVAEYAAFRGRPSEAFWSDGQLIADFEATLRFVLGRVNHRSGIAYRDDPAILAWETGNELECPTAWTRRVAATIKRLDPNHLVLDGRRAEILTAESFAAPGVDVVQTHHYEKSAAEMIAHIRASAALARGRAPYLVGEFGFLPAPELAAVMDAIVAEGLAGGLLWSLRGHNRDGGFYTHQEPYGGDLFRAYHWPGFGNGRAYGEAEALRELRRRAFAIRGESEPPFEPPEAPTAVEVTPGGLVSWRGAAGASEYDVERRAAAELAWKRVGAGVSDAVTPYRPPFADPTARPGSSYFYRVVARNRAGASAPSPPFGPVTPACRTLIDELADRTQLATAEGGVELRSDRARAFREDPHTLAGRRGASVSWRTPGPLAGARVVAFTEKAGADLGFAVSADGVRFAPVAAARRVFAPGDDATYGYQVATVYRLEDPPERTRYLQVEFRDAARLGRVELEYREEGAMDEAALKRAIEAELRTNIAPFWRERSPDNVRGGFIPEMASDGTVRPDAPRGLILNARLLWAFAALYRELGDARDRELARRAFEYLQGHFLDRTHGGYVWRVGPDGRPLDAAKKTYGQAFAIYALSEYHLATGEGGALDAARRVFELLERHAHDPLRGGYLEARAPDWDATSELRLGDGEPLAAKSMNTHLHLLEALASLYRAWPDPAVAARLGELIDLFGRHILVHGGAPGSGHLRHFFAADWTVLSDTTTYGHNIEAAWLLAEAADALGDDRRRAEARAWAAEIGRAVRDEGVGDDGGLAYEARAGAVIDDRRDWWCQAEAVVGFWHVYAETGDRSFAEAAARAWGFIATKVVDRVHGDWFWRVRADGSVDTTLPKVSEWKCPYHNTRMCLEMMRRLGGGGKGEGR